MTHWLIFVQVIIPLFKNRKPVYEEFCKLWSSPEFKAKSEKRDRTMETMQSIDMALMGISGRGSTW
jgi:hypothetical protein